MGNKLAMNIVNQLFDLAEVSVEKRQAINDKADAFVTELIQKHIEVEKVKYGIEILRRRRKEDYKPLLEELQQKLNEQKS